MSEKSGWTFTASAELRADVSEAKTVGEPVGSRGRRSYSWLSSWFGVNGILMTVLGAVVVVTGDWLPGILFSAVGLAEIGYAYKRRATLR